MKAWIVASFVLLALNIAALWRGWANPEALSCLWASASFHALAAYEEGHCRLQMADKMTWCARVMNVIALLLLAGLVPR